MAQFAERLQKAGVQAIVYTNGESLVRAQRRWIYERSQWPIKSAERASIREINHTSWAIYDAIAHCDILHVQSAQEYRFVTDEGSCRILPHLLRVVTHLLCQFSHLPCSLVLSHGTIKPLIRSVSGPFQSFSSYSSIFSSSSTPQISFSGSAHSAPSCLLVKQAAHRFEKSRDWDTGGPNKIVNSSCYSEERRVSAFQTENNFS